jgi:hypothetical protein
MHLKTNSVNPSFPDTQAHTHTQGHLAPQEPTHQSGSQRPPYKSHFLCTERVTVELCHLLCPRFPHAFQHRYLRPRVGSAQLAPAQSR